MNKKYIGVRAQCPARNYRLFLRYYARKGPDVKEKPEKPCISRHRRPLPCAHQQQQHDGDVEHIPRNAVGKRRRVGAGGVEDHAGDPAAERHAEHGSEDHDADAHKDTGLANTEVRSAPPLRASIQTYSTAVEPLPAPETELPRSYFPLSVGGATGSQSGGHLPEYAVPVD